jgi:hypothetical protein
MLAIAIGAEGQDLVDDEILRLRTQPAVDDRATMGIGQGIDRTPGGRRTVRRGGTKVENCRRVHAGSPGSSAIWLVVRTP